MFIGLVLVFWALTLSLAQADSLTFNNGTGNSDWANASNWQTGVVAGQSDDASITASVTSISSGVASVNSADFSNGAGWGPLFATGFTLTVATMATFHDTSYNLGTINGNATFDDSSQSYYGTINGNAIFNDSSSNYQDDTIKGNATFNDTSYNYESSIRGNATFNDSSYNEFGGIGGNATFNGASHNFYGVINGNATFNGTSYNDNSVIWGNATFNDASYNILGTIKGNATFNGASYNDNGVILRNATFNTTWYSGTTVPVDGVLTINGSNYWSGSVNGTVYGADNQAITSYVFNDDTYNNGGAINGNATFNTTYYSGTSAPSAGVFTINGSNTWSGDVTGTVYGADNQAITSYVLNNSAINYGTINGNATFNDSSRNYGGIIKGNATFNTTWYSGTTAPVNGVLTINGSNFWSGNVTGTVYGADNQAITSYVFNNSASNRGAINGNAMFNNTSYNNEGTINGNATFNDTSYNYDGAINGNATFNTTYYSGTTTPSGGVLTINGSHIWSGDVTGTVYGADNQAITSYVFNNSAYIYQGTINGNATFNNTSYNRGIINGNAVFNDTSDNGYNSIINGNAMFNTTSYSGTSAPSGGVLTINGSRYWAGDVTGTVYGSDNQAITSYVFNNSAYNNGTINGNVTFNNTSYSTSIVNGDATFNDTSRNAGTINGNATFDTTYYSGTTAPVGGVLTINGSNYSYWSGNVTGTVYGADNQAITSYVFNNSAFNEGTINGNTTFNDASSNYSGGIINGSVVFNSAADQSGTINAGNGIVSGNFSTSAGITFESGTVLSDISGSGGLTKTGTGTVMLSGNNAYSGGTTISAGTLQVASASALGTGAVVNNATLDIGTTNLLLGGSYTQNAGSALNLTVNSASSFGNISSVVAASVAGGSTINVTLANSIAKNTTFTILNTEGAGINFVNGLPTVISSNPHVSFTDSYANGNLVLTASSITTGFSSLANNGNSQVITTVLENIPNPSSGMTTILNTLGSLSNKQISAALGTMGPVVDRGVLNTNMASLTSSIEASLERAQDVLTLASSRKTGNTGVSSGDESPLNGMWAKQYGGYLDQGTREGIPGYNAWNTGTVVGVDHLFSDNLTVGASLGYAYGNINSADNTGSTYISSAEGTIYAGYQGETHPFYVDASGSFAWNWYNGQRNIDSINSIADSSYQGQQTSIYLDGGYKFDIGHNWTITPLASLQWTHLSIGSYTETNAGALDLMVNRQSYNMLESGLGAGISYEEKYNWGTFTPEVHAKWLYDYIGDAMVVTSSFTGGGASFTSNGASPARDGVDIGSKLSFDFKRDISLIAGLDAELKDNFFGIYGSVSMRYKF